MDRDFGGCGRIHAVHEYRSPRTHKRITAKDKVVRDTANALVSYEFHLRVLEEVGASMADVLGQQYVPPISLIPVPNRMGDTSRMLALCTAIRQFGEGICIQDILEGDPHQSQCKKHRLENPPLGIDQIRIRVKKAKRHIGLKNAVLIDNVVISGTTYLACRDAIRRTCSLTNAFGNDVDLLVWADARHTIPGAYRRVG